MWRILNSHGFDQSLYKTNILTSKFILCLLFSQLGWNKGCIFKRPKLVHWNDTSSSHLERRLNVSILRLVLCLFRPSTRCCVSLIYRDIYWDDQKVHSDLFCTVLQKNMNELLPNLIHCLRREGTGLQSLEPEFRPRATSIQSLPYSAFQKHQQNKPTRAFQ